MVWGVGRYARVNSNRDLPLHAVQGTWCTELSRFAAYGGSRVLDD